MIRTTLHSLAAHLAACLALAAGALPQGASLQPEHAAAVAELQPRIDAAIDHGVEWILGQQQRDGSWSNERQNFNSGQTALCVYTLLKSKVPSTHPAIQRGVANLKSFRPKMFYAAAAQVLALTATRDAAHHEHIRELVEHIAKQQDGTWTYPNEGEHPHLHQDRDLSITQFALLAFRAAQEAGLKVPKRCLVDAFNDTLRYQESPQRGQRQGKDVAGFRYRWGHRSKPTGSMTTAGLASLQLAALGLGKSFGGSKRRELEQATALGVAWLVDHFSVKENPEHGANWTYYYLYGLERVGALLETEYFGPNPWYLEGAQWLIEKQADDGHWNQNNAQADTCFALLFLQRATAPTTGRDRAKKLTVDMVAEAQTGMQATGGIDGTPLRMWVTKVAGLTHDDFPKVPLRISKVEYLVDGEAVAAVLCEPPKAFPGQTFLASHTFRTRGEREVAVRLHTMRSAAASEGQEPGEPADEPGPIYESPPVAISVQHVLEPWMLDAATAGRRNLLREIDVTTETSSAQGDHAGARAFDGDEVTGWRFSPSDRQPTLTAKFRKSVRAKALRLVQLNGQLAHEGDFDRILKVEITLDRDDPFVVELDPDELRPTVFQLEKATRVKSLTVRVLDRKTGKKHRGIGGFAELELH